MKTAYTFNVKYLGPTNTKGSRYKITQNGKHISTIPYDYRGEAFTVSKAKVAIQCHLIRELGFSTKYLDWFFDANEQGFIVGFLLP